MPVRLLLTLSLLLSVVILPAVAQSAPPIAWQLPSPASSRPAHPSPPLRFLVPFQFGAPAPVRSVPSTLGSPTRPVRFTPSQRALKASTRRALLSPSPILIAGLIPHSQGRLCLDLCVYTVAPDIPGSDSTHLTGSSTCQPASDFSVSYTAGTHPLLLR